MKLENEAAVPSTPTSLILSFKKVSSIHDFGIMHWSRNVLNKMQAGNSTCVKQLKLCQPKPHITYKVQNYIHHYDILQCHIAFKVINQNPKGYFRCILWIFFYFSSLSGWPLPKCIRFWNVSQCLDFQVNTRHYRRCAASMKNSIPASSFPQSCPAVQNVRDNIIVLWITMLLQMATNEMKREGL